MTAWSLEPTDIIRCWVSSLLMLCRAFTAAAFSKTLTANTHRRRTDAHHRELKRVSASGDATVPALTLIKTAFALWTETSRTPYFRYFFFSYEFCLFSFATIIKTVGGEKLAVETQNPRALRPTVWRADKNRLLKQTFARNICYAQKYIDTHIIQHNNHFMLQTSGAIWTCLLFSVDTGLYSHCHLFCLHSHTSQFFRN